MKHVACRSAWVGARVRVQYCLGALAALCVAAAGPSAAQVPQRELGAIFGPKYMLRAGNDYFVGSFEEGCQLAQQIYGSTEPYRFFPRAEWKGICQRYHDGQWIDAAGALFRGDQCEAGYDMRGYVEYAMYMENGRNTQTLYYGPDKYCIATWPILDVSRSSRNGAPAGQQCSGNPILPLLGTKRQTVATGLAIGGIPLELTYDTRDRALRQGINRMSLSAQAKGLPALWSSTLHRPIAYSGRTYQAARGNGSTIGFNDPKGIWVYESDPDVSDRFIFHQPTWSYHYYDAKALTAERVGSQANGQYLPARIARANGTYVDLTYSTSASETAPAAGFLVQARDNFGRVINFTYEKLPNNQGRLKTITDNAGATITVSYDASGNLSRLTWADGAIRTFLYENIAFPWAMTGVVDENGVRHATFGYDAEGRAISTEYAGGVNRFSASYTTPPQIVVTEVKDLTAKTITRYHDWVAPQGVAVTGPNGSVTNIQSTNVVGIPYVTSRSQPAGSGCAASTSNQTFDGNGNVTSRDDFNGTRSCYANDTSRNVETARVDGLAAGTDCSGVIAGGATLPAGSRKTSTQWHPQWRLRAKVAEPGRITTTVYNGQPDPFNGNAIASCAPAAYGLFHEFRPLAVVCKQVEQATTDADGSQGFSASLQAGVPNRVWQWTYNQYGQVLTERDPLNNQRTNVYYASTTADYTLGDLQRSTNAAGHVTQYPRYNRHGQVLRSIDPNGATTDYTYDARQRLRTAVTAGQTTTYDYDAVGQLTRVTAPDGSYVAYQYDAAHRLVAVSDGGGNRIDYTLDNAGNRTAEQVRDTSGTLKRQLARVMDALGRVQQATGRE